MNCRILSVASSVFMSVAAFNCHAKNLIVNGNFAKGNSGFSSEYTYSNPACGFGKYMVGTDSLKDGCSGWVEIGPRNGKGEMMIMDGATIDNTVICSESIKVNPRTNYIFVFWWTTLDEPGYTNQPTIQAYINGDPVGKPLVLPEAYDELWHKGSVKWNSESKSRAVLSLIDIDTDGQGNDFALDDLAFYETGAGRDGWPW